MDNSVRKQLTGQKLSYLSQQQPQQHDQKERILTKIKRNLIKRNRVASKKHTKIYISPAYYISTLYGNNKHNTLEEMINEQIN